MEETTIVEVLDKVMYTREDQSQTPNCKVVEGIDIELRWKYDIEKMIKHKISPNSKTTIRNENLIERSD